MGGKYSCTKKHITKTPQRYICFLEGVSSVGKSKSIDRFIPVSKDIHVEKLFLDIIQISNRYKLTVSENLTFDRVLYTDIYKTLFFNHCISNDTAFDLMLIDRSPVAVYIYDLMFRYVFPHVKLHLRKKESGGKTIEEILKACGQIYNSFEKILTSLKLLDKMFMTNKYAYKVELIFCICDFDDIDFYNSLLYNRGWLDRNLLQDDFYKKMYIGIQCFLFQEVYKFLLEEDFKYIKFTHLTVSPNDEDRIIKYLNLINTSN